MVNLIRCFKIFVVIMLFLQSISVEGWVWGRRRRTPAHVDRPYINPRLATWTSWNSVIKHKCDDGKYIYRARGIHSNAKEDRSWAFYCKKNAKVSTKCSHSGWKNSFDQPLLYQCPNGVLTGVHSKYSFGHYDREYDFRCCKTPRHYFRYCFWTDYLNNFDGVVNYKTSKFLVGMSSYHSDHHEDRRWRFLVCYLT